MSISIETSAKNKIQIHLEHPGPRNKRLHVTYIFTLQYLARTKDEPCMLVINKASGSETARRSDFPTRRDSESDSESDSQDFSSSDSSVK